MIRTRLPVPLALGLLLAGCGDDSPLPVPTPPPGRPFALGLGDFPHARTVEAVDAAFEVIRRDADMVMAHFDDGVPWDEALDGAPYPAAVEAEIAYRADRQPPGHTRYLAVTPLAFTRGGLAPRRGETGTEPLLPPWSERALDDPLVAEAFFNHCLRMIEAFDPDYFAYGIEVNMLERVDPAQWPAFVRLAAALYPRLKAAHPGLPVFLTFQVDSLVGAYEEQEDAIREVLAYTDVVAASSYWYTVRPDPDDLAPSHFDTLARLAPEKPFAIAETAWPAEDVTEPYPEPIPASEDGQRRYVEILLDDAFRLEARFVCWSFTRDYDDFWEDELQARPDASLVRLWKDTGLYRGDGAPRPALDPWRNALARPRPLDPIPQAGAGSGPAGAPGGAGAAGGPRLTGRHPDG